MDSSGKTAAWPDSDEDSGEDSEELDEEEARQLRELDEEMDRFEAEHPGPSLQELFAEIEHINDRLWRLSATLRNPTSTQNRLKKSESCDKSHFKSYDVSHIAEKFPRAAEFLVHRLGEANTRRRQLLEYHRTHHDKISRYVDKMPLEAEANEDKSLSKHQDYGDKRALNRETEVHPKGPKSQAEISQTTASKFVETPLKSVETSSDAGVSQTSYARSEASASKYRLQVPFLADTNGCNGSPFQCAICFMIIQIGGTRDWTNHVFDDLRPYVCTFDDCTQSSLLFETRHEWFEHELEHHRRCWTCRHCNKTFTAKAGFSKHLEELHPELIQIGGIESVVAGCERVLDKHECPLCPGTYSTTRMRGHLADHLQQVALFVLRTEQDDVSGGGSNDAANMDCSPYSSETWSDAESRPSPEPAAPEAVSGNSELEHGIMLLLREVSHISQREKQWCLSMGDRQRDIEPGTVGLQDFAGVFMVTLAEFSSLKQEVVFSETLLELLVLKQPLENLHHELTNPDALLKYTHWSPTLLEITKSWSDCMIQFKALVERVRLLDDRWNIDLNKIKSGLGRLFRRIHSHLEGAGGLSRFGSFGAEAETEATLRKIVSVDEVARTSETPQQLPRVGATTNVMADQAVQEEEGVLHLEESPQFPGGNHEEQLRWREKLVLKQLEEIPLDPERLLGVPEPTARVLDLERFQTEKDLSLNFKEFVSGESERYLLKSSTQPSARVIDWDPIPAHQESCNTHRGVPSIEYSEISGSTALASPLDIAHQDFNDPSSTRVLQGQSITGYQHSRQDPLNASGPETFLGLEGFSLSERDHSPSISPSPGLDIHRTPDDELIPQIQVTFAPPQRQPTFPKQNEDHSALPPPPNYPARRQRSGSDPYANGGLPDQRTGSGSSDSSLPNREAILYLPHLPRPGAAPGENIRVQKLAATFQPPSSATKMSRRSSTNSLPNREAILDLAHPQSPGAAPGENKRVQKHAATFQCHLCPKKFTRAYNLRSHLRTHTDERPFVCTVCSKAFARQHDCKGHEGLHSGENKFVCKGQLKAGGSWGCSRRFARADALGRHFRSEAGRVCIRPLVDEETAERQQRGLQVEMEMHATPPGGLDPGIDAATMGMAFPSTLLEQYPALATVNWGVLPMPGEDDEGCEDVASGRSSFDAGREYEDVGLGSQRNS